MTVTPCSTTVSFGRVSWQLPPRSAARSTITEPGAMAVTMSAVMSPGRGRGSDHDRLVAGDGGHGRERVHALGAGDTRHQLKGKGHGAGRRDLPNGQRRSQRTEEPDERLITPQEREVVPTVPVVGAVAEDLHDDIACLEYFGASRRDPRTLL